MPSLAKATAALERVDWDFPQSGNPSASLHGLHSFPGNFISHIPSFLIQILSAPGDLVCDPFVGSGTSAIEANRLGRHAIVSDRLSPCIRIASAKLRALHSPAFRSYFSTLIEAMWWDGDCFTDDRGIHGEGSDPWLEKWYAPKTLAELRYLWKLIEHAPFDFQSILTTVFSDILFACASTNSRNTSTGKRRKHHWGWVADNVIPRPPVEHPAAEMFRAKLSAIRSLPVEKSAPSVGTLIIQQDARSLAIRSDSVDLVVTSPPYIGVIDYAKANRLLYLWMGWSLDREREEEIGARYRRKRRAFVEEYDEAMDKSWREIARILRRSSYCAVVIGESHRYEGTLFRMLRRWNSVMPMVWGPVVRNPRRRRISERRARTPREYVCVFQKA